MPGVRPDDRRARANVGGDGRAQWLWVESAGPGERERMTDADTHAGILIAAIYHPHESDNPANASNAQQAKPPTTTDIASIVQMRQRASGEQKN
jgi:hypothetical protein